MYIVHRGTILCPICNCLHTPHASSLSLSLKAPIPSLKAPIPAPSLFAAPKEFTPSQVASKEEAGSLLMSHGHELRLTGGRIQRQHSHRSWPQRRLCQRSGDASRRRQRSLSISTGATSLPARTSSVSSLVMLSSSTTSMSAMIQI
ncbi:hypothetical protein KSP40_PGU010111 [Platanthera guangdongensis]|uniref:Uncharacterized protein n=1 Tax=Platanthera guangdongensis TaxID=2320717 RepID=A0ABR2MM66_9ASPA